MPRLRLRARYLRPSTFNCFLSSPLTVIQHTSTPSLEPLPLTLPRHFPVISSTLTRLGLVVPYGVSVVGLKHCCNALGPSRHRCLHTWEQEFSLQGQVLETNSRTGKFGPTDGPLIAIANDGQIFRNDMAGTESHVIEIPKVKQFVMTDRSAGAEISARIHSSNGKFVESRGVSEPSSSNYPTVVYEAEDLYCETSSSEDMSDLSDVECEGREFTVEVQGEDNGDWFSPDSKFDNSILDAEHTSSDWDCLEMEDMSEEDPVNNLWGEDVLKVGTSEDGSPYLHELSVEEVTEILDKARAKDVRVLHVQESCEWVDRLVFASGRSSRHLRGMADAIVHKVKQGSQNVGPNSFPVVEGRDGDQWMAVDCGSIVVHLFREEARNYYNLEEFWGKKANPRPREMF